jgi:hypothetical protein
VKEDYRIAKYPLDNDVNDVPRAHEARLPMSHRALSL